MREGWKGAEKVKGSRENCDMKVPPCTVWSLSRSSPSCPRSFPSSAPCPPPFLRVSLRLVSCLLRFHSTRSARPVGEEDVRRTTRRKSGGERVRNGRGRQGADKDLFHSCRSYSS